MQKLAKVGILPVILVLLSGPVDAATIYSQTPVGNTGVLSDADNPSYGAEIFTLDDDVLIEDIVWRGWYNREDVNGAPPDNFSITIFADQTVGSSSLPGAALQSWSIGTAGRTDTGAPLIGGYSSVYEYSASLGSGFALSAGTYWLSIYNNTSTACDGCLDDWFWHAIANGSFRHAQSSDLSSWLGSPLLTDTYFIMSGQVVPVPAAAWLFASALGLLGWIRRKKA
jgi:hypothetical protein